jgi:hypothetical protein
MANDTGTHGDWLIDRLRARAALLALLGTDATHPGVYWDEITPPPKWPGVVLTNVRTAVATCLGPGIAGLESLWHVKAVVRGRSYAPAFGILREVEAALATPYGQAQVGAITEVHREHEEARATTDEAGQA